MTPTLQSECLPSSGLRTVVLGGALASSKVYIDTQYSTLIDANSKVYIDAQWDPEEGNLGTLPIAMQVSPLSEILIKYNKFSSISLAYYGQERFH